MLRKAAKGGLPLRKMAALFRCSHHSRAQCYLLLLLYIYIYIYIFIITTIITTTSTSTSTSTSTTTTTTTTPTTITIIFSATFPPSSAAATTPGCRPGARIGERGSAPKGGRHSTISSDPKLSYSRVV